MLGWFVSDEIVEMTICKLSHQFRGSLGNNDQSTLRQGHDATEALFLGSV